jgi:N-acetylglucosamine-6-phosphate deacetylase
VEGDRIARIVPDGSPCPSADRVLDLDDAHVLPGFIDLHIHGAAGVDVTDTDVDSLERLARWLASQGVTRFVPTLVPTPLDALVETTRRLASWISGANEAPPSGAIPVGVHFEGPFVNRSRCGALDPARLLDGTARDRFFSAFGAGLLAGLPARMITVAPEIDDGLELIREAVERGFVVSLGHTEADAERLEAAVLAGARHMTHFMNAMPPVSARAPGPVGWGLLDTRVSVDLIADLHHVDPLALRLVVANKTPAQVALISDAVAPAGLGDGVYRVWDEPVIVRGGRTANAAGGLAGSATSLGGDVANCLRLGFSLVDVALMASTVPARVLGLDALGAIAPGMVADLVAVRDELEPVLTLVGGRVVFSADGN